VAVRGVTEPPAASWYRRALRIDVLLHWYNGGIQFVWRVILTLTSLDAAGASSLRSDVAGATPVSFGVRRHPHSDMAYVPDNAEWFLAEIVQEIRVDGCKRNIVHINSVIVHASSPHAAYVRATEMGKRGNSSYVNERGKRVTIRFRGLRNLDVIYDPLEDGCEIMYTEKLGLTEKQMSKLVRPKGQLEVFMPIRSRPGRPNFSSKEIMDEVKKRLRKKK